MWSFLDWNLRQSNFKKNVSHDFEDFNIFNVEAVDMYLQKRNRFYEIMVN